MDVQTLAVGDQVEVEGVALLTVVAVAGGELVLAVSLGGGPKGERGPPK